MRPNVRLWLLLAFWSALGSSYAILPWSLVVFAQEGALIRKSCVSRETHSGFIGNSDFYGLGIRIGIYLQWWSSLLAFVFLPEMWDSLLAAYLVFSIALVFSLLLLIFQHGCAFTAEIIVIFYIFWGGFGGILYGEAADSTYLFLRRHKGGAVKLGVKTGLAIPLLILYGIALPISTWFWLRLVSAGEVDFVSTPGGTTYFLLARVSAQNKQAAGFLVFFCFYFGSIIVACWAWFGTGLLTRIFKQMFQDPPQNSNQSQPASPGGSQSNDSIPQSERKTKEKKLLIGFIGAIIFTYSILAIELTLVWNSVSEVYTIGSTGEIIPLIVGLCLIANVAYNMNPWKHHKRPLKRNASSDEIVPLQQLNSDDDDDDDFTVISAFQRPTSGAWH